MTSIAMFELPILSFPMPHVETCFRAPLRVREDPASPRALVRRAPAIASPCSPVSISTKVASGLGANAESRGGFADLSMAHSVVSIGWTVATRAPKPKGGFGTLMKDSGAT
jgi:hypothetical protein